MQELKKKVPLDSKMSSVTTVEPFLFDSVCQTRLETLLQQGNKNSGFKFLASLMARS